jgi:creatinine amidohydrolase
MQWEKLTVIDFKKAVKKTKGVCILPLGVIEKHGEHLPLGTDGLIAHRLACLASEIEPAIVFPQYYFGQIYAVKHHPGTIAIKPQLMLELLEDVCDEIARNGLKKIILINVHGGNAHLIGLFVQMLDYKKKDYVVYVPASPFNYVVDTKLFKKIMRVTQADHAGEFETSITLDCFPELVKTSYIPDKPGIALKRLAHLKHIWTSMTWYSNYPKQYEGDADYATKEKGRKLVDVQIKYVIEIIKSVKKDEVVEKLYNEFFRKNLR